MTVVVSLSPFLRFISLLRLSVLIAFLSFAEISFCGLKTIEASSSLVSSKQEKHSAYGLVLSFVSRCLDTPMKHSLSFWK